MFNCHRHVKAFHDDRVLLTEVMKQGMRDRRSANENRLKRGLASAKKPAPLEFIKQGSYAMHTMVQSEYYASDIDDGVVFAKDALVGERGGAFSARDAKAMVLDAMLKEDVFNKPPEIRTNCVRVYYEDGFTLDMPVYRTTQSGSETTYELASVDWNRADPKGVTSWFNKQVGDKSPDTVNGRQMRRVVKLLKAWARSRKNWSMPSGLVLSTLTDEVYYKDMTLLDRDDEALLLVMERMQNRLQFNLVVSHPVVPGASITKTSSDANMVELRDRLATAVQSLQVLRRADCTELDALTAFRDLFDTDYFDARIAELEESAKKAAARTPVITVTGRDAKTPVVKKGGVGRYA